MDNTKYSHVISLGFFCSVAIELEKNGFREGSLPFDWTISSLESVIQLIDNHFADFFSIDDYYQNKQFPNYYANLRFDIEFYHEFTEFKGFEKQFPLFVSKFNKRIERFYSFLSDGPVLFLRYIKDSDEMFFINSNYSSINDVLKSFNSANEIKFIANEDIRHLCCNQVIDSVFFVCKDNGDIVCRKPFEKNAEILSFLSQSINLSEERKLKNLSFYNKKQKKKKRNLFAKIRFFFNKLFVGSKTWKQQY